MALTVKRGGAKKKEPEKQANKDGIENQIHKEGTTNADTANQEKMV